MQRQRLDRAARYRREANKYAELAKVTAEPTFLLNLYRQTAVRYVLMAEDLERSPDPRLGAGTGWVSLSASLNERADRFLAVYERR
jgi:hypothetical protein